MNELRLVSPLTQLFIGVATIIFAYYGFFNYKRYVKRHRLRVAIYSELMNAKRDSRISYENLETLEDVNIFDYGKNSSKFYENNMDKLHLLSDVEINAIVTAYDRLEDRERYLEIVDSVKELDESMKQNTDLALAGREEIESALQLIEKKMNSELLEGKFTWYNFERKIGIRNDVLNGKILKLIRGSSDAVMDIVHNENRTYED